MPEDAVTVEPDKYRVMLENDRVRVVEFRYSAGAKSAMHSHPDLVACPLTAAKATFVLDNGESFDLELTPGEPVFVEAQSHTVENTGATEIRGLLVELK